MFLELRECKARNDSVSSGTVIKKIRASDE